MKVKRQSEISSASLAGTATNNSETPTHLGAVTPGVQPYQGSWREGSVRGMREESREIGVQSHAGGFNGVPGGDWSLSTLSGGGHKRRTGLFQSSGFSSIVQLLSIFRARHGCTVALSLAVCRWLKSEFVWMCSPIRQPPTNACTLTRTPPLGTCAQGMQACY